MTVKEDEDIVVNAEPDATLATAVGVEEKVGGKNNEPPIPANHSRYYCSKCRAVSIICVSLYTYYLIGSFSWGYCFEMVEI